MDTRKIRLVVAVAVAGFAFPGLLFAQTPPKCPCTNTRCTMCPTYNDQGPALPTNGPVNVVVETTTSGQTTMDSEPSGVSGSTGALTTGLTAVTGQAPNNDSGISFNQMTSTVASSSGNYTNPAVLVNFDTTSTQGTCTTGTAVTATNSSNAKVIVGCSILATGDDGSVGATVTIFLNAQGCGSAGQQCFNASAAGYTAAVQSVIEHELYHCLGIGDTTNNSKPSLMNQYPGQGNNPNSIQGCDNLQVQRQNNIRLYGSPCPPIE